MYLLLSTTIIRIIRDHTHAHTHIQSHTHTYTQLNANKQNVTVTIHTIFFDLTLYQHAAHVDCLVPRSTQIPQSVKKKKHQIILSHLIKNSHSHTFCVDRNHRMCAFAHTIHTVLTS